MEIHKPGKPVVVEIPRSLDVLAGESDLLVVSSSRPLVDAKTLGRRADKFNKFGFDESENSETS